MRLNRGSQSTAYVLRAFVAVFIVALICNIRVACANGEGESSAATSSNSGNEIDQPSSNSVIESTANSSVMLSSSDVISDDAFDRYIDIRFLQEAVQKMDPSLLTDAGLQIAEGERILFRPHKACSSDTLFKLAKKIAVDNGDTKALDRLKLVAKELNKKELIKDLESSSKLASTSRGLDMPAGLQIDRTSLDELIAYKSQLDLLRRAEYLGDRATIDDILERLKSNTTLPKSAREYIEKRATEAKKSSSGADDADNKNLLKLCENSRYGMIDIYKKTGVQLPPGWQPPPGTPGGPHPWPENPPVKMYDGRQYYSSAMLFNNASGLLYVGLRDGNTTTGIYVNPGGSQELKFQDGADILFAGQPVRLRNGQRLFVRNTPGGGATISE